MRRCWVNFQCWGVLLICIIVGQGPVALAVGAGGDCLDIFSLICPLSPSLWETARYRLKYCLKGPLNPKQPTNQNPTIWITVGQGPTALTVGAGGGCLDIFTLIYLFSPLSPSLWEMARYRLKYCLKGPLNPKQPTNQPTVSFGLLTVGQLDFQDKCQCHPSEIKSLEMFALNVVMRNEFRKKISVTFEFP